MITTLTGNNSFGLRRRLDELIDKFVSKYGDLALERYDAEDQETNAIIEGLASLPFLAARKMAVVRSGGLNKDFTDQIEQIISSIGDSTDVIFYEPQIDRRTAYFKLLKAKTSFEEFNDLDARGLANWLVNQAKKQGGQLSFGDANYLVQRLGTNQSLLANELDKLVIYNPKINRQNIDLLTEPTPQSQIFDLLDAAFTGRKELALRLYDDQRAQKVEPQAILAMITWQLQRIALTKHAGNRSVKEISRDSGFKEYPLQKAKQLADKMRDKDIQQLVSELLDIDLKSKTTVLDLDEALKTYIATIKE